LGEENLGKVAGAVLGHPMAVEGKLERKRALNLAIGAIPEQTEGDELVG
jgi:hypothetical protein